MRSIGIQTDGYLLPYPPDSSWLKRNREFDKDSNHTLDEPFSNKLESNHNLSRIDKTEEVEHQEESLKDMIEEIQTPNNNLSLTTIPSGDPLTKKKQSHRILTKSQNIPSTTTVVGRGRLGKKVYVDPNTFIRDEDITDSYSSNDSYSYPSHFSINGKSIPNSFASKPKFQPKKFSKRPNQDEIDDSSIISNITTSPR